MAGSLFEALAAFLALGEMLHEHAGTNDAADASADADPDQRWHLLALREVFFDRVRQ
ncbi:hypothetical protein D3C83_193800 [compost metagenome]